MKILLIFLLFIYASSKFLPYNLPKPLLTKAEFSYLLKSKNLSPYEINYVFKIID